MSVSQHRHYDPQMTQNQKNQMSDDPRDGARGSDTLGGDAPGGSPEQDAQDQAKIEEFGRRGAGNPSASSDGGGED
ncbi:MAG: hypothetical protein ACK4K7_01680 [Allosphingosinicella sp.]|uniref:hypothetical protein n=1 Tax=Allosphingosinicella sp. TaxID=2823234 RepID=UPI003928784D